MLQIHGLYTALDSCHVVNIDRMVECWVWPSEAIGRNLHYYLDLASGPCVIKLHTCRFSLWTLNGINNNSYKTECCNDMENFECT